MANLYKEWSKKAYEINTQEEYDKFWNWYLPIEKDIYNELLTNKDTVYSGTVSDEDFPLQNDDITSSSESEAVCYLLVNGEVYDGKVWRITNWSKAEN